MFKKLPRHIAIIPEGNRRWAKKRSALLKKELPSFFGHKEGAKTTEKIFNAALNFKIPYLTFWGLSLDNIKKRDASEVEFLFKLYEQYFQKLAWNRRVHQNQIKINVFGRWNELFPASVRQAIRKAIGKTRNYKNYQLSFLMAYSGIDEMINAIQRIAKIKKQNPKFKINEEAIKANLWTKILPPVDLVVRTGGEPHWSSGFMMWDTANAQFYFTDTFYPDFSIEEFERAIKQYSRTNRRMGG